MKSFLIKKIIKAKFGDQISDRQIEALIRAVEQNPALFQTMVAEIERKRGEGMSEMDAARAVFQAHEAELRGITL